MSENRNWLAKQLPPDYEPHAYPMNLLELHGVDRIEINLDLKGSHGTKLNSCFRGGFQVSGSWDFITHRNRYKAYDISIDFFGSTTILYVMPEAEEINYFCGNTMKFTLLEPSIHRLQPDKQKHEADITVIHADKKYLINRGLLDTYPEASETMHRDMPDWGFGAIAVYVLDASTQKLLEVFWLHSI